MEIVQADTQAMLIIESNDEASEYLGWKPWANTLFYYSFDNSNLNDWSWKWNNWTWYSWAWTFVDWIKWKCAHIAWTRWIRIPITFPTWDFTYSICAYVTNLSSPQIQSFLWTIEWWNNIWVFHFHWTTWNQIVFATSRDWTNRPTTWYMEANKRINIILTRSWNVWKIYKNWTQIFNQTIAYSMAWWTWTVGCEYTDWRAINWNIDEVILENRAWTDTEILKYVQKLWLA